MPRGAASGRGKIRYIDFGGRVAYRHPPGGRDADFLAFIEASVARGTLTAFIAEFLARTRRAKNGCLEWIRIRPQHCRPIADENGYGTLTFELDGVEGGAVPHRASWLLFVGPIAPEHPATRHLCHNKRCVNWFHLEPGTTSENLLDNRHKPNLAPRLRPMPTPAPWMVPLGGWPDIGYRPPDKLAVAKKLEAARIMWLETQDPGALAARLSRLLAQLGEGR